MRRTAAEKYALIRLVEGSELPVHLQLALHEPDARLDSVDRQRVVGDSRKPLRVEPLGPEHLRPHLLALVRRPPRIDDAKLADIYHERQVRRIGVVD